MDEQSETWTWAPQASCFTKEFELPGLHFTNLSVVVVAEDWHHMRCRMWTRWDAHHESHAPRQPGMVASTTENGVCSEWRQVYVVRGISRALPTSRILHPRSTPGREVGR